MNQPTTASPCMRTWTVISAAAFALVPGFFPAPAAAQSYTMKVACDTVDDVQAEWLKRFASRVAARSGGRIKASTYPGGQLGTTPRVIEGVQLGSIEAYIVPGANFVGLDQRFQVTDAPGWFASLDHVKRTILDPRFRDQFLALGDAKGLKGISLVLYGPISYASRQPLRSPADFKGKKIRVAASKLQELPLGKLGATPVPIPLGEVLSALQQGTVDGVRLAVNLFNKFKYYDIVKYVTVTEEAVFVSVGVVSKLWFEKLPKDLQTIIVEEGAKLNAEMSDWTLKAFEGAEEEWKRNGGEIIRFDAAQRGQFMKIVGAAADEVLNQRPETKKMFELLKEVAEKNR